MPRKKGAARRWPRRREYPHAHPSPTGPSPRARRTPRATVLMKARRSPRRRPTPTPVQIRARPAVDARAAGDGPVRVHVRRAAPSRRAAARAIMGRSDRSGSARGLGDHSAMWTSRVLARRRRAAKVHPRRSTSRAVAPQASHRQRCVYQAGPAGSSSCRRSCRSHEWGAKYENQTESRSGVNVQTALHPCTSSRRSRNRSSRCVGRHGFVIFPALARHASPAFSRTKVHLLPFTPGRRRNHWKWAVLSVP